METSEKIKVYDKGIEINNREGVYETLVQYRTGDMLSPKIDQTEALALGTKDFVDSILNGRKPLTDGISGLNVVRILEASTLSIQKTRSIDRDLSFGTPASCWH